MKTKLPLDQLAIRAGTDKSSQHHGYTKIYERYFEHLRDEEITLFEAGYGGYDYPDRGGHGAKMWREYFPNARIISTDLHNKTNVPDGVKFYKGSQDSYLFWSSVYTEQGRPDIFIDDASHICSLTVETFRIVFPMLKPGGLYVVEDLETNYWDRVASDGTDFEGGLKREGTMIEYLKTQVDSINSVHSGQPNIFGIESIHFYEKMAFIRKK